MFSHSVNTDVSANAVCVEEIVVYYGNYSRSCTERVCSTKSTVRASWSYCAVGHLFRETLQFKPP
jgi:hypothetical protein